MAARLNPRHQEFVKDKIKGGQLIKALENHALGEKEMSSTQVQAAKILIDKIISNAATVLAGDKDAPLALNHNVTIAPALTPEQWAAAFAPKK